MVVQCKFALLNDEYFVPHLDFFTCLGYMFIDYRKLSLLRNTTSTALYVCIHSSIPGHFI